MDKLTSILDELATPYCIVNNGDTSYIILALPYNPYQLGQGEASYIDAFYPASNAIYHVGMALQGRLIANGYTVLDEQLNLKALAVQGGMGTRLYNQLVCSSRYGSRMALHGIAISGKYELTLDDTVSDTCRYCGRCEAACPAHALESGTFYRERCIRQWQSSPAQYPLRGDGKILGCDICQRVCPHNSGNTMQSSGGLVLAKYTVDELIHAINGGKESLSAIAADIGKNYARRNYLNLLIEAAGLDK